MTRSTRCCARHGHQVSYQPGGRNAARADEALTLFDGIAGAIVASEPVTAEMLATAAELKVIARSGVGYDSIDVAAAAARGIRVCNTPGVNHDAVAELTMALMLMAARRLARRRSTESARDSGRAKPATNCAEPPSALFGYGPSGRAVAQLGAAFGMTVLVHTAHPDPDRTPQCSSSTATP